MKKWAKDQRAALKGMQRDVQSLAEHAAYLLQKIMSKYFIARGRAPNRFEHD
jgi:hypothetical protein